MASKIDFSRMATLFGAAAWLLIAQSAAPQTPKSTPELPPEDLHTLRPAYPVPAGQPKAEQIREVLDRVRTYLDRSTPARLVSRSSGAPVTDLTKITDDTVFERGDFLLVSYEWGVTYSGMLAAAEATGDARYKDYVGQRLKLLADAYPTFRERMTEKPAPRAMMRSVVRPETLDDAGAMCAAMVKAERAGIVPNLRPMIDNYANHVATRQFRLADGTLARQGPFPHTLWLDDLYMSVPALAQMGKLTGERRYYDDAVKQILQFSERMFVKDKGLYMHGWVQEMSVHPAFHWARANGWAILAMVELLDVLPEDQPGRAAVIDQLRAQVRGLAACQSGGGLWHQLLDRNDSYLETSASAMYVYAIARAINRGWIDRLAYREVAQVGWNAVAARVNARGQVEGTCVGTGMQFEPMFYYYRPTSVFAAHGYGPVLLAGSEMLKLIGS